MMKGKKYTAEQIVAKLWEAEVLLGKGVPLGEVCRQLEITDVTYYRWKKEYGGLRVDQAKRLKELEAENSRLEELEPGIVDPVQEAQVLAARYTWQYNTIRPHSSLEYRPAAPEAILRLQQASA